MAWSIGRPIASRMAGFSSCTAWLCLTLTACSGTQQAADPSRDQHTAPPVVRDGPSGEQPEAAPEVYEPGPITKGSLREHPAKTAWVFDASGKEPASMDLGQVEARRLTPIDLSNGWVPYIFSEKTAGLDDQKTNTYRERYIGLAENRVDSDGDKLRGSERNYLELYGIPPTIAVVYDEWQQVPEVETCLTEANFDATVFTRFQGTIAYTKTRSNKGVRKAKWYRKTLVKAMKKAKLDTSDSLLIAAKDHPKLGKKYTQWREFQDEVDVIDHAQRRFRCEKLFSGRTGEGKFTPGVFDNATTHALAAFEKKHKIMGWGHFKRDNLDALALDQNTSMHNRLLRVVEERVVSSTGIIEDGSAAQWRADFTWKDSAGKEHGLRDLAGEAMAAVTKALDLETPEKARASLEKLADLGGGKAFENLVIAVKLPDLPEYYQANMTFNVVIDRGDVWYDFPYNDEGKKLGQPRRRRPKFTLYTTYREQEIPLVRWRTTIGSWRNELNEGKVYYKYKESDVGPRVWKEIVAAPTWIPPATTPASELLRRKWKDGGVKSVVNYDEFGPSYTSAYGLVAAYHIKEIFDSDGNWKADHDNGIRTHGSVDYMSILRRFSHGCHRLYNMNAVRLFSFVLRHRDFSREGQTKLGFGRKFEHEGKEFSIRLGTRGYKYRLSEPIPVMVTKGRIKGKRKRPLAGYIEKPGVNYTGEEDTDGLEGDTDGTDVEADTDSGVETTPAPAPALVPAETPPSL